MKLTIEIAEELVARTQEVAESEGMTVPLRGASDGKYQMGASTYGQELLDDRMSGAR